MRRVALPISLAVVLGGAASAQEFQAPRFEALEQQKAQLEQRQLDSLEKQKQDELFRSTLPQSPQDRTASTFRQMDIDRRQDELRLQGELQRDQQRRDETARTATLANRRIAASSVLVVRDPERFFLPPIPSNQFYARLDGRFVVVDRNSELVVTVVEPSPADPRGDRPEPVSPPAQAPIPR
jgi:hypothetical protein